MTNADWSRFHLRVSIHTTVETAFRAWTTPADLERWFLRSAAFTTPQGTPRERNSQVGKGDTYTWLWHGYGDDGAEEGVIQEMNGKDFLRFTFSGGSVVSVLVKSELGETIVELLQENIPVDEDSKYTYHIGCMKGWTFYLANLKSILEGGIDLRNKNVDLKDLISA